MSIFSTILAKILPSAAAAQPKVPSPAGDASAPAAAAPIPLVDVEALLDAMPGASTLNWRASIVDLMKLLGLDSSLEARKQLAHELNYGAETADSAKMNLWLHKQVMTKLVANGGKLPSELVA